MALHQQVKSNKKKYDTNYTLVPGCYDKFLIHQDKEHDCWRVTFYSQFSEGRTSPTGSLPNLTKRLKSDGSVGWMRRSWTYQKKFEHEIAALNFARDKAKTKKSYGSSHRPVILLQLDVDTSYEA